MTATDIITTLLQGDHINDPSGHEYKYDEPFIKRNTGDGWHVANLSVAYILNHPEHFRRVTNEKENI